jgi:single-strand DNA-binding protein
MASFNRVILMGNLTRDPEYKALASGQNVCRLGLACNRSFKNRQTGAVTQEVCFIDVDVWGAQAESCQQFLTKGRAVLVEGRLKLDSWEQDGQKRSKHSIVADRVTFLQGPGEEVSSDNSSAQDDFSAAAATPSMSRATGEVNLKSQPKPFDDDLPF